MARRTWSRRTKAAALISVVYVTAWVLFLAIDTASRHELRPAQHGPITPAPESDGSYRE